MMKKKQRSADEVKRSLADAVKCLVADQTAVPGGAIIALYVDQIRRLLKELAACKE